MPDDLICICCGAPIAPLARAAVLCDPPTPAAPDGRIWAAHVRIEDCIAYTFAVRRPSAVMAALVGWEGSDGRT